MKYSTIAVVYDLGPFISKVILELDQPLTDCNLDNETFQVHVVRTDRVTGKIVQIPISWGSDETYPSEGERKVIAAYISDNEGQHSPSGSYITLEMEVDPRISIGATIAFNGMFNVRVDSEYTITQKKPIIFGENIIESMEFTELSSHKTLLSDEFHTGTSTYEGIQLGYAAYQPKQNGTKRPLLIWLHGYGEGGTDPIIAVSGNKVVNLVSEDIQQYFGGCHVLGPQTPTMWMDDGSGQLSMSGISIYVESLKNLIDEYIAAHDDIDVNRIYIGGCSNGGFMTMKMIIAYPQMFAAAYPICEALLDDCVTESDIERIKNIPIWFTHATNDPIVDVNKFTGATYQRLIKAGAKDVHFSCFPLIADQTGKYFNEDGSAYEYNGHFSWVPALNNECHLDYDNSSVTMDGKSVTLFEWMSKHIRIS